MIETLREKYDDLREAGDNVGDYFTGRDEPSGRNAGVGPMEGLLALAVAAGAALVTREALQRGWRSALDREPPMNPASSEVDWRDALLWGALSGAIVGVARIASRRATSSAYNHYRS